MTTKPQPEADASRLLTDAHIRAISSAAREVTKGGAAELSMLDEPQLSNVHALAGEAENIAALCRAYTDAAKERDQLRELLSSLDSFNVFDFDPCTMDELTEVKDRARALIDKFPHSSEPAALQTQGAEQ